MRSRHLLAGLLLGAMAAGCPKPLTPHQRLVKTTPAATRTLLEAAGDRAAVVLMIHPDRWPAAARTLRPFFAGDADLQPARDVLAAPDLWSAMGRMAALGTTGVSWPARLDGWDPARPIVAALFGPQLNETVLAARAVVPAEPGAVVPPFGHRVLIPARDARRLMASLIELAGLFNWRPLPAAGELTRLGVGQIYRTSGGGLAALIPAGDHLRIELLTSAAGAESSLAELTAHLADPPRSRRPPITPAWLFAAGRDDLLVAHLRPWVLRDLGSQLGTARVYSALAYADADMRPALLAAGLSEVAAGYLLTTPRAAEFDDWALALDLDAGLQLTGVASLTEEGQRIWKAGQATALSPLAAAKGEALFETNLALDTRAMVAAAAVPPGLESTESARQIFEAVARGGFTCHLHYMLRQPVGFVKAVERIMGERARIQFPRAVAMRLVSFDPAAGDTPIRMAVAASFPAGTDTRWLREAMAQARGRMATQLYTDRLDQTEVTRIGVGLDPRQVFELRPVQSAVGQIASFALDPGALANLVNRESPAAAAALDKLDRVQGRTLLVDRALVGDLKVGLLGAKPRPTKPLPDMSGLTWESPGQAAAGMQGAVCMEAVTQQMIAAFSALSYAAPDQRARLMDQALEGVQEPLACALAAVGTSQDARRVQLGLALFRAQRLERSWERTGQLQVLDTACEQGHQKACHLADAARKGPEVALVTTRGGCLQPWHEGEPAIRVGAAAPPPERIAEQTRGERGQTVPLLALDADLLGERLTKLGAALKAFEVHRVGLLVKSPERGLARIPMELGLAPERDAEVAKSDVPEIIAASDPFKPIDLAMAVSPTGVVLRGPGGELEITKGGLDMAVIAKKLDEVQQVFPRMRLNLLLDAQLTWRQLAPVLAAAACGEDDPKAGRLARALWLVLDEAALEARMKSLAPAKRPSPAEQEPGNPGRLIGLGLKLKPGEVRMGPTLPKEEIKRVIHKHQAEVRYCYERELVKDPNLAGRITANFTVGPKGKVTEATIRSGLDNAALRECLLDRIRSWAFPAPLGGGVVNITYPFIFRAAE